MFRFQKLACVSALALGCITVAHGKTSFNSLVAFGDSLTDNGNYHSLFPNSRQRFTTNPGKVTSEDVAYYFGLNLTPSAKGGNDFAWGGARADIDVGPIPSMQSQVNSYLNVHGGRADPNALYTVWIGANDLLAAAKGPAKDALKIAQEAAHAEVNTIKQLHDAGARCIVVFNLPDIAKTPRFRKKSPQIRAGVDAMVNAYNRILWAGLAVPGNYIIPVDTYKALNQFIAHPARYNLDNVTDPACTVDSAINCDKNTLVTPDASEKYFFADGVHPTDKGHRLLSNQVVDDITTAIYDFHACTN